MDDPITRGLLNMICFLLLADYVVWVFNGGSFWGAM
jgi:hypothetical protein